MTTISSQQKTALDLVNAIQTRAYDKIPTFFASDFVYKPHPARLGSFGKPSGFSASELVELIKSLKFIKSWDFDVDHPINVVEGDKQIAIQFSAKPTHVSGKTFSSEYVYFLKFDDEGKVRTFDEFFDTKYLEEIGA